MARKVTISKDMILDAALRLLIREGYSNVNIKTIAAELNCSTQPIAWHFENMNAMRTELAVFAEKYAKSKIEPAANASDSFFNMGRAYISLAVNEPKLFSYLYLGERPIAKPFTADTLTENAGDSEMIKMMARQTDLSNDEAVTLIRNIIIYSHGLATMIATGVLDIGEKEAMEMILGLAGRLVKTK